MMMLAMTSVMSAFSLMVGKSCTPSGESSELGTPLRRACSACVVHRESERALDAASSSA